MRQAPIQTIQQTKPHKFYAYREKPFFVAVFATFLIWYFNIDQLVFVYPTLSVLGDLIHYKIFKLKESDRVDPGRLFYDEGITPAQLDDYMDFMVKVRLYAYGIAWLSLGVGWFFHHSFLSFVFGYCLINVLGFLWARFSPPSTVGI